MPNSWEYVELRRRFAIVINPGKDENGRVLQGVWLTQLKTDAADWDFILKDGTFLDNNVAEQFLLAKIPTIDIAEDYASGLSNRLNLRVFRVENDYLRDRHRIIECTST